MIPNIHKLKYKNSGNFFLIAGPCVIESRNSAFQIAKELVTISKRNQVPLIFKASYKKANRSSINSFTGIGDKEALDIIKSIGDEFDIPTITDVHSENDVRMVAKYVDSLQIPAFLCRQTDLLIAAASTGKWINIKKGQFLSPDSMKFAVEKVKIKGNNNVMLTERGNLFGYRDLIVDYRSIPIMKQNNCPVILDITHSLQQPNQLEGVSGGQPELISTIAKAGIAAGVDGIFLETHPDPSKAKSDGANMIQLDKLEKLLQELIKIHQVIKS